MLPPHIPCALYYKSSYDTIGAGLVSFLYGFPLLHRVL